MTYGLIEAGQHGWTGAGTLGPIVGGLAVLAAFFLWERHLARRPGGQPLVDLALFRSASFTWGVVLITISTIALIGVLFTMPQYFQAVVGTDAMGSGLRLLPLIAGFVVGLAPAAPLNRGLGAKATVALGFAVLALGMVAGARTGVGSSTAFVATWMGVAGVGFGVMFATAASAALSELSAERSGVGSAMLQALKNVGAPLGSAILGSVLVSAYQAELHLAGLPPAAAAAVRQSVFGGVAVAEQLRSPALLGSVRAGFARGVDVSLLVSAGIAVAGMLLALAFLPGGRVTSKEPVGGTRSEVEGASGDRR